GRASHPEHDTLHPSRPRQWPTRFRSDRTVCRSRVSSDPPLNCLKLVRQTTSKAVTGQRTFSTRTFSTRTFSTRELDTHFAHPIQRFQRSDFGHGNGFSWCSPSWSLYRCEECQDRGRAECRLRCRW